jgi:hypothetical protein
MGICVSAEDVKKHRHRKGHTTSKDELGWDITTLQAKSFATDGSNIKLVAEKHMPHRICSVRPFMLSSKYTIKIRYVNLTGNGSFCLGIFFFQRKFQDEKV